MPKRPDIPPATKLRLACRIMQGRHLYGTEENNTLRVLAGVIAKKANCTYLEAFDMLLEKKDKEFIYSIPPDFWNERDRWEAIRETTDEILIRIRRMNFNEVICDG